MKNLFLVILCISMFGCVSANFQPATSTVYPKVQEQATVIYKNDIQQFSNCNVIELGNVNVAGNSFVNHNDLLNRASELAAERGATHLLVLETHTEYLTTYTTNCYNGFGGVQCNTSPNNFPKPHGTYMALRIECNNNSSSNDSIHRFNATAYRPYFVAAFLRKCEKTQSTNYCNCAAELTWQNLVDLNLATVEEVRASLQKIKLTPEQAAQCLVP